MKKYTNYYCSLTISTIQIVAQNIATGHAINQSNKHQSRPKIGLPAMMMKDDKNYFVINY